MNLSSGKGAPWLRSVLHCRPQQIIKLVQFMLASTDLSYVAACGCALKASHNSGTGHMIPMCLYVSFDIRSDVVQ